MELTKNDARWVILDSANAYRASRNASTPPYRMRHIQQAVCVCRRRRFVTDPYVYEAAGFRGGAA